MRKAPGKRKTNLFMEVIKPCVNCGDLMRSYPNACLCRKCTISIDLIKRKIRAAAANAVSKAVKNGTLQRLDGTIACVDCGCPARHYDHRDYDEHLDVSPVCVSCNIARGPAKQFIDMGFMFRNYGAVKKKRPDPHTAPAIG